MSGRAARMFLLQYGAERVPRSLSLRNGPSDLGWEPLYGVLVDTDDGWVLFDTGMGSAKDFGPTTGKLLASMKAASLQ